MNKLVNISLFFPLAMFLSPTNSIAGHDDSAKVLERKEQLAIERISKARQLFFRQLEMQYADLSQPSKLVTLRKQFPAPLLFNKSLHAEFMTKLDRGIDMESECRFVMQSTPVNLANHEGLRIFASSVRACADRLSQSEAEISLAFRNYDSDAAQLWHSLVEAPFLTCHAFLKLLMEAGREASKVSEQQRLIPPKTFKEFKNLPDAQLAFSRLKFLEKLDAWKNQPMKLLMPNLKQLAGPAPWLFQKAEYVELLKTFDEAADAEANCMNFISSTAVKVENLASYYDQLKGCLVRLREAESKLLRVSKHYHHPNLGFDERPSAKGFLGLFDGLDEINGRFSVFLEIVEKHIQFEKNQF